MKPSVLAALFAVAGASASLAQNSASDGTTPCTSDAMIVFDASGSMAANDFADGPPSRIDRTREAITRFLPRVSKVRNLGLVIYGPGKNTNACRNATLRFSPVPDAGERILDEIGRIKPAGRTPLTSAVQIAIDALDHPRRPATIVLLTDGQETCAGDPCALARKLRASDPEIVVHVVGYKLQSFDGKPGVSGAECMAGETGGKSVVAETVDELIDALSGVLECPKLSKLK